MVLPAIDIIEPHPHENGDSIYDADHARYLTQKLLIEEDAWVTDIEFLLHNAPYTILHHLLLYSETGEDPLCPGKPLVEDYFRMGQDTKEKATFPKPYGVFLPKGTEITLSVMLHNTFPPQGTGETYRDVQGELLLTTVPNGRGRTKALSFQKIVLQDAPYCKGAGNETFVVPPRAEQFVKVPSTSNPDRGRFVFPYDTYIIRAGTHLHPWDGGKTVNLFLNGELLQSYSSKKVTGGSRLWSTYGAPLELLVKKGDTLELSAEYSNPNDEPIIDAMGFVVFYYIKNP